MRELSQNTEILEDDDDIPQNVTVTTYGGDALDTDAGENRPPLGQQLELFELEEIVRPDYNIGKYATLLFASPHLKNLGERRKFEWPIKTEDGEEAIAAITIAPLKDQIVPTTTTFKVLMAIIQLWRMQGANPNGMVYYSDRQLAEVAGWPYSGKIAERIRNHVSILQGTQIDWRFSYKRGSKIESRVQQMSLISDATYFERKDTLRRERFKANHIIELNRHLVHNMLNNVVRPINFESLRQISSDASTRLYMMLDMFLAKKTGWARTAKNLLVIDLGYEGDRYRNRGERKRTVLRLIKDLDGKDLATGKLKLTLEETVDKSDWKLVARKIKRIEKRRRPIPFVLSQEDAELLASELLDLFTGIPKAGPPKLGFMVFLCRHYPQHIIRDAISRAKADYMGNVKKTVGAVFRYELEQLVRARSDLIWYKDAIERG